MLAPPVLVGAKLIQFLGSIMFGGMIVTGATGSAGTTTSVAGGAIRIPEFLTATTLSRTTSYVAYEPINSFLTATGGNVKTDPAGLPAPTGTTGGARFAAACIPNPLTKFTPSLGSGAFLWLSLEMGNNPSNLSYDITLEKKCNSGTGGYVLANNVSLATGAVLTISGSRLPNAWNGLDYIKVSTLSTPNAATTGRVRGAVRDIFGE